ncbi:MAG: diguanylate cyclase [Fibrobacter sp.]|nr:diguanylate cyclase [Fibrobacter sp.]
MTTQKTYRFPLLSLILWFFASAFFLYLYNTFNQNLHPDFKTLVKASCVVGPTVVLVVWLHIRYKKFVRGLLSNEDMYSSLWKSYYNPVISESERWAWYNIMRAISKEEPIKETLEKILPSLQRLFPDTNLALYIRQNSQSMGLQLQIGENVTGGNTILFNECTAISRGKFHISITDLNDCKHHHTEENALLACAPIIIEDKFLGLLTAAKILEEDYSPFQEEYDDLENKMLSIASMLSLFIHNHSLSKSIENHHIRDTLTGLFNRRYLEETLVREFAEASRYKTSIGIILITPIIPPEVIEKHGQKGIDHLMWEFGQRVPDFIRSEDIPCRLEDKFCIVMPKAPRNITQQRAVVIKNEFAELTVLYQKDDISVTFNVGTAVYPEDAQSVQGLLNFAEENRNVFLEL